MQVWLLHRFLGLLSVQVPDAVNILIDSLVVPRVQVADCVCFRGPRLDLVDDRLQHCVPVVVEQSLQKLVFVVNIVYLNDKSVNFANFVLQVYLLLGFDHVDDLFGFFAKLRQFFEHHGNG